MTVREIMSEPAVTCGPETTMSAAARMMRDADYGTLPVTDRRGNLVGIITDRDICLAIAGSARNPAHIAVHEAMTRKTVTITLTDTLHAALATMRAARVRRLPVLASFGRLRGIVSIEDLVVRGLESGGIAADQIASALRTMYERRPVAVEVEIA